jgi:hypothetical protein
MISIWYLSDDSRGVRLSNFEDRDFTFDEAPCKSIESVVQSFAWYGVLEQREVCLLNGMNAPSRGRASPFKWTDTQKLFWNGTFYPRHSEEYIALVTRLYDTVYEQDPSYRNDLLAVGYECDFEIREGTVNPNESVLTKTERLYQLNRLRFRALKEREKPPTNLRVVG